MATETQTLLDMQHELAELKRRHGATYRAIGKVCGISKTTAHRWTGHIEFEQPLPRTELDIVPAETGGFTSHLVTVQPPTPPRNRRGRRRTRPHIQDTSYMHYLEMDIKQRLNQNPIKK